MGWSGDATARKNALNTNTNRSIAFPALLLLLLGLLALVVVVAEAAAAASSPLLTRPPHSGPSSGIIPVSTDASCLRASRMSDRTCRTTSGPRPNTSFAYSLKAEHNAV